MAFSTKPIPSIKKTSTDKTTKSAQLKDRYASAPDSSRQDVGRRTSAEDYPIGNEKRQEGKAFDKHGRAYDRDSDTTRDTDEDEPVINQDPNKFYARNVTDEHEGDDENRYFGGDMGYKEREDAGGSFVSGKASNTKQKTGK